jgi:hypothetical protein
MADKEIVYPYALTTLARVKDRLSIKNNDFDSKLIRWINSATDYIQNACGGRQFVKTTYINEVYSPKSRMERYVVLRQIPVVSVSSFQYRAGPPSAPSWTSYTADQYELENPRPVPSDPTQTWYPEGMVRLYGVLPTIISNAIRVSYVAGYAIDWPNAGNGSTHLLPADLTDLCENLVVRKFKRRELAGKQSEGLQGASTNWRNSLDQDDIDVIDSYTLLPLFS